MSQYSKAIAAFFVAYLGILVTSLQAGAKYSDPTTYITPLIGAISSLYVVYRVPNTTK